jgi:hypothetical protein
VGLPHSEIRGSKGARPSPRLIAACHVLHRLSVPRHPPDALKTLDLSIPSKSTRRGKTPARDSREDTFRILELCPIRADGSSRIHLGHTNYSQCPRTRTRPRGPIRIGKLPVDDLIAGGGERIRTDDPLLAKQVLSQLSYTPGPCGVLFTPVRVAGGLNGMVTPPPDHAAFSLHRCEAPGGPGRI